MAKPHRPNTKGNGIQGWIAHFDALDDPFELFLPEARDYVSKLKAALPLSHNLKALDFGCGLGFVAELLAPCVGKLLLWDTSVNMRRRAGQRVLAYKNACLLDRLDLESQDGPYIDVILVNSVIQYMSAEELSQWLGRWSHMLLPGGSLVISDIPTSQAGALVDFSDSLFFFARHKLSIGSFFFLLGEFRRFWETRRAHPLLRLNREELHNQAAVAHLTVEFLPTNLTYRKERLTAVFHKAI